MNIRVLNGIIISYLIFLIGCVATNINIQGKVIGDVPDIAENRTNRTPILEKAEIKQIAKKEAQNQTITAESTEIPENYYDLTKLEKDVNEVMGSLYDFKRDIDYPDYMASSFLKYYVINTIKNENDFINNADDFCKKYCGENWDGWQYYINMSSFTALKPLLGKENFSNEYSYNEYLRDANFVKLKVLETVYEVENGNILEYQFIPWYVDYSGTYFEGAGEYGTYLIYKIYCAPNMTILLRPKWDAYQISFPVATYDDAYKTWSNYILPFRKELLAKGNELLKRCGVDKAFFDGYRFPEYSKSEFLVGYWKVYYSRYFNLSGTLDASAKRQNNGKFLLKQINVSFTNDDDVDLYNAYDYYGDEGIGLRITVVSDDKRELEYYKKNKITGILGPGDSIKRSFSHKEVEFLNNVTIEATLYVEENVDVRPIRKTYTTRDFEK